MEQRIPPSTTSQSSILQPGTSAPDFTLNATPDQLLSLKDYLGKPFILAFYPADFSPVCGDEMTLYNEILPEFKRYKAEILGISVDGPWCHLAFSKDRNLHFPLLSDFEPKGEVARKYGAYDNNKGVCERALFVVDETGIIRWSYLSPIGVNPGAEGVLDALEAMNSSVSTQEKELESRQRVAEDEEKEEEKEKKMKEINNK